MNYLMRRASFHSHTQNRSAVKLLISTLHAILTECDIGYDRYCLHRQKNKTKQNKTKASFTSSKGYAIDDSVNVFYHRCNGIIPGNSREPVIYSLV